MRVKDCAERIQHCMELCLIQAMDKKMTEQKGEDWFDQLYAAEEVVRQKDKENNTRKAVLEERQTAIGLCDLQALLKIFVFRKNYNSITFSHVWDTDATKIKATLDNLRQFRNKVLAHKEIAEKAKDPGEYSYDHAVLDMLYLLRCFPDMRGKAHPEENLTEEICYYEYALSIYEQYKEEGGMYDYAIEDIIAENNLKVSVDAFKDVCDELKIPAFRTKEQVWYISSRDSKVDVARVIERLSFKDMQKQAADAKREAAAAKASPIPKKWIIIGAAIVALLLLLSGLGAVFSGGADNEKDDGSKTSTASNGNQSETDDRIQEEIDTFVEGTGNTFHLKVGEGHKAIGSVWLNGGGGSVHSTDKAVVTVSSGGNVKAVGEGEAFVVVKAGSGMFEVTKYIVQGVYKTEEERIQEEIDTFVEEPGNTTELKVGEGDKPDAALWLNGGGGSVYSTDETVVTVSSSGNVNAVGEGEAFVVIKAGTGMYSIHKYIVKSNVEEEDSRIQDAIDTFAETALNTSYLSVGDKHTPGAAVWLQGGGFVYSTDEAVIVVSTTGTATAVGTGEAFVVIQTSVGMYSIQKYIVE